MTLLDADVANWVARTARTSAEKTTVSPGPCTTALQSAADDFDSGMISSSTEPPILPTLPTSPNSFLEPELLLSLPGPFTLLSPYSLPTLYSSSSYFLQQSLSAKMGGGNEPYLHPQDRTSVQGGSDASKAEAEHVLRRR